MRWVGLGLLGVWALSSFIGAIALVGIWLSIERESQSQFTPPTLTISGKHGSPKQEVRPPVPFWGNAELEREVARHLWATYSRRMAEIELERQMRWKRLEALMYGTSGESSNDPETSGESSNESDIVEAKH